MKVSRRFLLASVAASTLCHALPTPSSAWFPHVFVGQTFHGNPNVTITAINTSGGIACSRALSPSTAGKIPCWVHVSAKNITASGTSIPYEDLSYSWNFGDASSAENFTNPVTGLSVNSNNGQTGPEAVHVYRTANTYTITLTISGQNGGGFTTTTVTTQVIVSAFSPATTLYCDSSATGGTNSGTQANPFTSMSSLNTALSSATAPVQVFMAQGSNFGGTSGATSGLVLPNGKSNIHMTSYVGTGGAGANPIITVNAGNAAIALGTALGGNNRDDIVLSNITATTATGFTGSSSGAVVSSNYNNGPINNTNVYLDGCSISDPTGSTADVYLATTNGLTTPVQQGWGLWNCTLTNPQSSLNGHSIFYNAGPNSMWWFVFGCSISGGSNPGSANTQLHHIYPNCLNNSLYRWINFGAGGSGTGQRNYCINLNWDNITGGVQNDFSNALQLTQYYVIDGCMLTGTLRAHDAANSINNILTVQFTNFVCQSNALANLSLGQTASMANVATYTFRDNNCWNNGGVFAPQTNALTLLSSKFYRNNVYTPIGVSGGSFSWSQPTISGIATTASSNQLTSASGSYHFPVNTRVIVSASSDTNIPNGNYWVVSSGYVSGSTFFASLATTQGGSAINAAANGTLTITAHIANTITFTDNKEQDMRSSTNLSNVNAPLADISGALIDRNSYYAPNQTGWNAASTLLFFDDSSGVNAQRSFTQWQGDGFDPNGTLPSSGFGWSNPSNGIFS